MSMQDMEGYNELMMKLLDTLPPEQVMSHYGSEQRLAGLPPEQRLVGLDRDHQALALPVELLRVLPDDYIRSLIFEIAEAIPRSAELDMLWHARAFDGGEEIAELPVHARYKLARALLDLADQNAARLEEEVGADEDRALDIRSNELAQKALSFYRRAADLLESVRHETVGGLAWVRCVLCLAQWWRVIGQNEEALRAYALIQQEHERGLPELEPRNHLNILLGQAQTLHEMGRGAEARQIVDIAQKLAESTADAALVASVADIERDIPRT